MRKRVDRDSVRVVKRDGVRRIVRSEFERAGLWPATAGDPDEFVALREENERLRTQVAEHGLLTRAGRGSRARVA